MVFLPFAILTAAVPSTATLSGGVIAALFALALLDALLAFGRLDGISVELPEVVRLYKDREAEIELQIHNDKMKVRKLRLGLALPKEIHSPDHDLTAELPTQSPSSRLSWPCKPFRRGRYFLDKCYLEGRSPLGFWAVRVAAPARSEIRVYPNLLAERKNLGALFLNRMNFGINAQRQIGKGREFEHLRDYSPDDCYQDIHWKATAKQSRPITKVFQIERTQEVYVVIDASRLSARRADHLSESRCSNGDGHAGSSATILERFVTAALIMGLAAERKGDHFGILTFGDRVHSFVRARNGKAHYSACREALYTLQPQGVAPDFSELFTFIGLKLRRRALLVFMTNLDDLVLSESFGRAIDMISRRHLVLVNMLKPRGSRPVFSSRQVQSIDDLYTNLGGHLIWDSLRETQKVLQRKGVGFSVLENENMCTQLVSQYLSIKQRQIL
jgi:uncharacterized protein (DUF58 family)